MWFCKDCNTRMVSVLSFSKNKNEKFNQCTKCFAESKHHTIKDKDLNFEEIFTDSKNKIKEGNGQWKKY